MTVYTCAFCGSVSDAMRPATTRAGWRCLEIDACTLRMIRREAMRKALVPSDVNYLYQEEPKRR